jgi:monooxygenase
MSVKDIERDIIIVGAGISGISMAYFIQKNCPQKSYIILEGRERLGGTWDLFQYPGIRSDSDMYTFGYSFHPWIREQSISDGNFIVDYVQSAAEQYDIYDKIRFQQHVKNASWSSDIGKWSLEVVNIATNSTVNYRAQFMFLCTGYYNYESGYDPEFPGKERFKGRIVHPQKWPSDLNYDNQNIVIIGSGATAVTLLPTLAKTAKHVTMLQRSPSYIASVPSQSSNYAKILYGILPRYWAFTIIRWARILSGLKFYWLARAFPKETIKSIHKGIRHFLGPDYDIQKHFTPSYAPWDQRVCVCPDGDFFQTLASKKGSIVTDTIDTFTENGILTKSGELLPADIIVTATGLKLLAMGGIQLTVDGKSIDLSSTMVYKGKLCRTPFLF